MKNKIRILLLLLSIGWYVGYAQEPLHQEFLSALKTKNTSTETICCDFTQIKHNTMLAQDVQSTGKFYYKRPVQLALLYNAPSGDRIVMGKTDFLIVAGGSHNAVKISSNPLFQQLQQIFASCFSGDIAALCSHGTLRCEKGATTYTVRIAPQSKRERRYIAEIVLVFSAKDMLLDELQMVEASGNYTHYRFRNKLTNQPIADDRFDCNR